MAEPIRMSLCNIRFEEGKLWKPRYDSLINYSCAPQGFQFEPAFMLRSAEEGVEVEVVFQILPTERAVFDVVDGSVRWDLIDPPKAAVPVSVDVSVLDQEHRVCRVRWTRTGAPLTALRIRCRSLLEEPGDWAWSIVEGGVYLVILDPGEVLPGPLPQQKAGEPWDQTVRLLGIDEHQRPVYDLFCGNVPPELVPEPAFRAAHGESLDLKIALDLPELYADVRFEADEEGQANMLYAVPPEKPPFLNGVPVGSDGKDCRIQWCRPAEPGCYDWRISNFYAEVGFANGKILVDPTVIEPPACDASGVCGPPRDRCGKDGSPYGRQTAKVRVVAQGSEPGEAEPGRRVETEVHGAPRVDQR
jgi:hypothetical protein